MQHFLLYLKITFCLLIGFLKWKWLVRTDIVRSSCPEAFLGKGVLKLCIKFTGEHPCRSAVSIKLQSNFIENTFRYECSPIYICCIFSEHLSLRTPLDGCFQNACCRSSFVHSIYFLCPVGSVWNPLDIRLTSL